ncbi:MAG: methyltransferase domain-containing protein [Uliginosibacterium sp.]|nr:methyltransferase domain-containing protein [Uliginosibacterium sp.]
MRRTGNQNRRDYDVIASWVQPGARVLDLGCGDGSLLQHLADARQTHGYGIERDSERVIACIQNGINVLQIDLEQGLSGFEDQQFDYVVMSLSLQAVHNTERILSEMLRVGNEVVVSFPNFGYWRHRVSIKKGAPAAHFTPASAPAHPVCSLATSPRRPILADWRPTSFAVT